MSDYKSEFIYIHSIEDIDPRKITIRDLNKKYIDREGRKYAIKFDLKTRQIKFVRIATSYAEALRIKKELGEIKKTKDNLKETYIIDNKKEEEELKHPSYINQQENNPISENKISNDVKNLDFFSPEEMEINENDFYKELERETKKCIESIKAIEKTMNRNQIFEKLLNSLNDFFDLQKKIELKCYDLSEEAFKTLKELVYYPRNINHYLNKLPDPVKKQIEKLDPQYQLDYIKRYEIYRIFRELIQNINKIQEELESFYYKIPALDRERKPLLDLVASFAEIKETTTYILQKMNLWYSKYQKL